MSTLYERIGGRWRNAISVLAWTLKGGVLAYLFQAHVAEFTMALGPSMLPTLNVTHDFVIVDKISHRRGNIRLGDVVVCTSPTEPTRSVCKRVLGMPKDIVCVDPTLPTRTYIRVPDGHIWLMGDNMSNSTDSRTYGAVPLGLVTGKVVCKVWPTFAKVGNTLVEYHPSSH